MINLKTKNRVFPLFPQRNWEIMETYSVTFHNFRFSGRKRVENAKKWPYHEHTRNGDDKILSQTISTPGMIFTLPQCYIFNMMTPAVIHQLTASIPIILRHRCQKNIFCHRPGIFSHPARPAVPDAPKSASRHSGAGFLRGGRTYDHATF